MNQVIQKIPTISKNIIIVYTWSEDNKLYCKYFMDLVEITDEEFMNWSLEIQREVYAFVSKQPHLRLWSF